MNPKPHPSPNRRCSQSPKRSPSEIHLFRQFNRPPTFHQPISKTPVPVGCHRSKNRHGGDLYEFAVSHRVQHEEPNWIFEGIIARELHPYLGGIVKNIGGIAIEINGMSDHVHLLVKLKPTKSISEIVREIKANSSKWMNQEKWKLRKFGCQDGYSAFTVSKSQANAVRKYIQEQQQHHQRIDFQAEYLMLLQKHEIDFDKSRVFE